MARPRVPRAATMLWLTVATAALTACAGTPGLVERDRGLAAAVAPPPPPQGERLLRVAGDLEARGEIDTALVLYQRVAASTRDAASYTHLGDAYLRAARLDDAMRAYQMALAQDPNDGEAQLGLGSALVRRYRLNEGIALLEKAAQRLGTALAYNRLGVAQTLAGRVEQASVSLAAALRAAPTDADIAINLALASALRGDRDRAVALMRQVARSPEAEVHHWRDIVIVSGLTGETALVRSAAGHGVAPAEIDALLRRAAAISAMDSVASRGRALGSIDAGIETAEAGPAPEPRSTTTTPPAARPPAAAGGATYVVQLSARRNETEARASFDTLQARYPRVLSGRQPIIRRADLGERGVFFRAAVGPFATVAEGNQLCGDLKTAGGECLVQRDQLPVE